MSNQQKLKVSERLLSILPIEETSLPDLSFSASLVEVTNLFLAGAIPADSYKDTFNYLLEKFKKEFQCQTRNNN